MGQSRLVVSVSAIYIIWHLQSLHWFVPCRAGREYDGTIQPVRIYFCYDTPKTYTGLCHIELKEEEGMVGQSKLLVSHSPMTPTDCTRVCAL